MKNINFIKGLVIGLLIAVASWSLFSVANYLMTNLLASFGIESELWVNLSIIGIVVIILIVVGYKFKTALKQLI